MEEKNSKERKSEMEYLKIKLDRLKKHSSKNPQDKIMKRILIKTEAKFLKSEKIKK